MSIPPKELLKLVDQFQRNIDSYMSPAYNEAMLRQEFVNPFFEALGWDIYNKAGFAEAKRSIPSPTNSAN